MVKPVAKIRENVSEHIQWLAHRLPPVTKYRMSGSASEKHQDIVRLIVKTIGLCQTRCKNYRSLS